MSQPSLCKLDNKKNEGTLSKRARYLEKLLDHFRGRWKKEYLTGIREHQKLKNAVERYFVRRVISFIFSKTKHLDYSGAWEE
jgi:RNase P protein component